MMRIKWTNKIRNEEVLRKIKMPEMVLLEMVRACKRRFLEVKMQQDRLFWVAAEGKIARKAGRGRRRSTMLSTM